METIIKMDPTKMLNANAPLFKVLRDNPPEWWNDLKNDPEIYIEIRKGNKIHAYFYGARIAEITFERGRISATCHTKYINGDKDVQNTYSSCIHMLEKNLNKLKKNALTYYVSKNKIEDEDVSENRIQGRLRIDNAHRYIDTEFEHEYDRENNIRFDLVAIDGNILKIEELKRIGDNRLRTSNMIVNPPEVLEQMNMYGNFMSVNKGALCDYYQTLIGIKKQLGLPIPTKYNEDDPLIIDSKPLLLIKNLYRYSKMNTARFDRIKDIREILEKKEIKYYILP